MFRVSQAVVFCGLDKSPKVAVAAHHGDIYVMKISNLVKHPILYT